MCVSIPALFVWFLFVLVLLEMEEALNKEALWARDLGDNLGQVLAEMEDHQVKDLVGQEDNLDKVQVV